MDILLKSKIIPIVTENIEEFKAQLAGGEAVNKILISPFQEANFEGASYDLHMGKQFISLIGEPRISQISEQLLRIKEGESLILESQEYIGLPYNIAGMTFGRVSWSEQGLLLNSAYVHPGFHGHLIGIVTNIADCPIEIDPGTAFCHIVFVGVAGGKFEERYTGDRRGQTIEMIMNKLTEPPVIPKERKTFPGFLRYLFGEHRIKSTEAEAKRFTNSGR